MNSTLTETTVINSDDTTKSSTTKVTLKPRRSWKEFMSQRNGIRVYVCNADECGKVFKYLSSLVKHERIHRGERPYVCKICDQSFVQSSNLRRHEKIHTGEKSYECMYCDKKFSTTSNLKQHIHTHKKENIKKQHNCQQCDRKYLYLSSLNKHSKYCEGASKSEDISEKTEGRVEEPAMRKIIKIEETVSDQKALSDAKTQSSSSSFIDLTQSSKDLLKAQLIQQEALIRSQTLARQTPLMYQSMSYPMERTNIQLLNSLLLQQTARNPIRSMYLQHQNRLSSPLFHSTALQMMNPSHSLYLAQQMQNNFFQQTNLALGYNQIPFF